MGLFKKINKFRKKELRNLIFFVTSKCPLNCKHCFYRSELNRDIKELTLKEIEKIIEKMPYLESVQLSGGEPFVRKDLVDVIRVFENRGIRHVGIPTNGFFTKMTVNKAKDIDKLNIDFNVTVSIDGFKELHNKIRGRDCWDKAIETFKQLKKNEIKTGFSLALSKLNYKNVKKLINFLESLNPDYINIILVRAKKDIMLGLKEFEKIRPLIEETIGKYSSRFYRKRQELLNDVYKIVLKGGKIPFNCYAGKIIAVLEPDGKVRSCELRKKLGNVRDHNYDIKKILEKDNKPKKCPCVHSCFLGPSMSYDLKWLLKNIIFRYV